MLLHRHRAATSVRHVFADPLAAQGVVEAARVAVVPCMVVALLVLLVSAFVRSRAKRLLVALAAFLGLVGVVAYGYYLFNSP